MSGLFGGGGAAIVNETPRISALRIQTSCYGVAIPVVLGKQRCTGNLLNYCDLQAIRHEQSQSSGGGGKGGGGEVTSTSVSYTYRYSTQVGICEGPAAVGEVWMQQGNDKIKLSENPSYGYSIFAGATPNGYSSVLTARHPDQFFYYPGLCNFTAVDLGEFKSDAPPSFSFEVSGVAYDAAIDGADPAQAINQIITNATWGASAPSARFPVVTAYGNYAVAMGWAIGLEMAEQRTAADWVQTILDQTNAAPVWASDHLDIVPYGDTAITANGRTWTPNVTPLYDLTDDDFLGDQAEPVKVNRLADSETWNIQPVEFRNRGNEYNIEVVDGSDPASVSMFGPKKSKDTLKAHGLGSAAAASRLGTIKAQRRVRTRNEYEFTLPWTYCRLLPMDIVTLTDSYLGLYRFPVRLKRVTETSDLEIQCLAEDFPAGAGHAALISRELAGGYIKDYNTAPGNATMPLVFEPPFALAGAAEILIGSSGGANWGGANIWVSIDGVSYSMVGRLPGKARLGVTTTSISAIPDPDISSALGVDLSASSGTLIGVSAAERDAFATLSWCDGEMLSYKDATLTGANAYTLANLRRGAYGSPVAAHAAGSMFVRCDENLFHYQINPELYGSVIYIKLQSFNLFGGGAQDLSELDSIAYTISLAAPPSDVESVSATLGFEGVTLYWPEIPDADRGSYAIEAGGITIATSATNAKNLGFVAPGSHTWGVRSFDTSRNPAESATPITVEIAAPSAPVVTSAFNGGNAVLSWPAPESSYPIVEYEILRGGSSLGKIKTTTFTVPVDWAGAQDFSVRAIDAGGNIGASGSVTITPVASSAPSVSGQIIGVKFALAWSAPTGGSLPTARYEIRRGVSFAAGTRVAVVDGLSYRAPVDWLGDATFWVAGIDTAGFPGAAGAVAITISAPAAPLASGGFAYDQAYVEWQVPASTLPLDYYEVRYGTDWSAGVSLGKFYSTRTQFPAQWLGDRNFMVRAYDLNSNPGTIDNVTLTITAAPAPSMTQEVIDNNVLLKWSQVAGTLPTETYELRKGASWDAAAIVGRKSGGFTTVFETVSGNFTYWLAAVDTAGNYGTPGAVTANVNQPPDYVLKVNFNSEFSGTMTNMMQDADGSLIAPVNTTESFSDHFTARGWASPQDQITAGYPLYIQPNLSPGGYVETYDYGAVLASNRITVTLTTAAISGTVTPGCTISVSADGSTWTDYADVWSVFATNFRYVKITLAFTAAGTTDLLRVIGLNLRLDSKLKTITKMLPCVAGDAGGTIMYLTDDGTATGNKLFIDVDAIQVTPSGTTPLIAIYDYVDTPYPLSLKALLFTTAGARASATASITVRGF